MIDKPGLEAIPKPGFLLCRNKEKTFKEISTKLAKTCKNACKKSIIIVKLWQKVVIGGKKWHFSWENITIKLMRREE